MAAAAAAAALLALCAALGAAAAVPAPAPAAWPPPPLHEGRDTPFVTGGHSGLSYGATSGTDVDAGSGGSTRRLIYYAHLPEVPATATLPLRRGRLQGRRWPPSYSIVDADADSLPQADRPRRREFAGPRYDRLPASPPYYRGAGLHYYSYSDRPDVDYPARRPDALYPAGRPDVDYPARRPVLEYSPRRPDVPFTRIPEEEGRRVLDPHRQGALYRGQQAPATPPEEPYRGYNPRQPAPWSLQVGAQLTVRDDGRRLPLGGGGGGGGGAGRRFYVSSQPPGPHYAVPLRYS